MHMIPDVTVFSKHVLVFIAHSLILETSVIV